MVGYKGIISNENATTRMEEPFAATATNNEKWLNQKLDGPQGASPSSTSRLAPTIDIKTAADQTKDGHSTTLDFAAAATSDDASFLHRRL